jgi:hypothetical protein
MRKLLPLLLEACGDAHLLSCVTPGFCHLVLTHSLQSYASWFVRYCDVNVDTTIQSTMVQEPVQLETHAQAGSHRQHAVMINNLANSATVWFWTYYAT